MILAGATPNWVRPTFFGANLLPFKKADGGIRPIAVGLTLRRLVVKVACRLVTEKCTEVLKPRQMGVGVKSGAEALVHAARCFVGALPSLLITYWSSLISPMHSIASEGTGC